MEDTQLSILNREPRKLPGPELLHELLATGVAAADESPAVLTQPALDYQGTDGSRVTLSYPQLHGIANIIAAEIHLQLLAWRKGGQPALSPDGADQFVVPVLIPQAPELYVSLLGILKAGGAFCPIQLDAPVERVRFVLDDVNASIVLTTRDMAAHLPADRPIRVILVDEMHLFDRLDEAVPYTPVKIPTPRDLAYVMYTSGSTGTPKGVGVPHIAATQSLLSHNRHIPAFQRFLQFAAPTFDVSVFEIFFPLFRGSTLVCANRAEMLNDLPHVICSRNIDACELTPSVAGSLLRSRANAPNLRLLLTIGEMLTEPVIREFGAGPDRTSMLWAMYGPTEAAIHCTLEPSLDGSASVSSIGFPLDTVSAFILKIPEDEGEPLPQGDPEVVPLGEVGELAVGGYQLASGYINRPEQTAAAFIDTVQYGRLYRTGDKARITESGLLECSGRMSGGQVKLRGQRIELGEIEQAVLRTSGCLGCAAAVINGMLVAFCDIGPRPKNSPEAMENMILESCRSWLPRFMIPNEIVQMAEFPRLASGKVHRKRIIAEFSEAQQASREEATSGTLAAVTYKDDLDRQLHTIATEILGTVLDSTSVLAASGLDSLKAIRFAASIRSSVAPTASAVDVLESRTLAALHSRIQALIAAANEEKASCVPSHILDAEKVVSGLLLAEDIQFVMECNPVQTAMLAETMSNPKAYCNWVELEFGNQISTSDVVLGFQSLIQSNESLRSAFVQFDGRLAQVVRKQPTANQVLVVAHLSRDFELARDASLLSPFVVQVEDAQGQDNKGVRAVLHIHHSVYDGWSMDLMRMHLTTLMQGGEIQQQLQYSSVVQFYREIPMSRRNEAERFWAESLNGFQPSTLPCLSKQQMDSVPILSRTAKLSGVDKARVDATARSIGSSPQAIFQASMAWLWSSLVGSPDVVLGTVTSGRTLPLDGIESVIGPCLQTVPVRTDLSRMRSIRDLLTSTHATSRALLAHAFLSLADIKKTAGVHSGQPLYDVLFVYQESLYSKKTSDDLVAEVAHQDYLETKLLMEVEPVDDGFQLRYTFHTDVFPEEVISTLIEQYSSIVEHIISNVDGDLSSISTSLPKNLLSSWNIDYRPFDGCPDLAHLVEEAAKKSPDSPALCFATSLAGAGEFQTLTFAELNVQANRIASYIQSLGVHPGDPVAIIMEKSPHLYAGILGILKAGCAYLPLLPTTPEARAQHIVDVAKVQLCLTDTATHAALVGRLPVTALDVQTADFQDLPDVPSPVPFDGSRVAYIVYTSGSTGVPKGVCVSQANVCSNLDVLSRIYPIPEGGRLLQSCSFAFDVSVFEIFFTWIYGMCLCTAVNDVLFEDIERAIRVLRVTHLSMTPTVASLIDPRNTPSVEFLVTAGEPLTDQVYNAWHKQLYQGYGPTEVTNICTVRKMKDHDVICHLGRSLENTSSFVLQVDGLDLVPFCGAGELCFGGDQVANGYLGQPELTAQKFIQHPSLGAIYRSGDIGRMLPDGSIMITGRMDDQIKLRGQRIELGEINSVLRDSGLLMQSITVPVRQKDSGSDQLASFIVPSGHGLSPSATVPFSLLDLGEQALRDMISELFNLLASRLPSYMVPSFLLPISGIPLTSSGKTDKRALLSLFGTLSKDSLDLTSIVSKTADGGAGDATAGPWTSLEKQLSQILADALSTDVRNIGRWTPLASLGLDSLSAIRVSKMLTSSLGKRIAISEILKNMSVAQLAQLIERSTAKSESLSSSYALNVFSAQYLAELKANLDLHALSSTKVLPCMPLQEAMLVSPVRGRSYVNRMLFKLQIPDLAVFKNAWMQMWVRHEILRTCFGTTDHASHPIAQIVLESYLPPWLKLDANHGETVESLVEKIVQLLSSPVDSYRPPVSFAVIKKDDEAFFSFVCHHAVYDGEAMGLLLSEVESLIAGRHLATEVAPSFESFLCQALVLPESTDRFWKSHLNGFRPALLTVDKSSVPDTSSVICRKALDLPLSAIQGQAKELGCSLLTTCQSAWACVLSLLAENADVCFGNVYNGRSIPVEGVDRLVAPCFNTLPVRADLSSLGASKNLLAYFQALNPEMMQYQFTPLRKIQRQHLDGMRLFDSLLLLQQPSQPLDTAIWTLLQDDGEMDIPLVCELVPNPATDELEVRLHSESNVLPEGASSLIIELFATVAKLLLQFSSSQIPARRDLPPSLQDSLEQLKLEFATLPEPAREAAVAVSNTVVDEMWSPTEARIRAVLSQLSGIPEDSIRRATTVYRLGLDSIRAVQVASVLRKGGLHLSAVDVMEHPSCMAMASFLSKTATTSNISEPMTPTSVVYTPPSSPSIAASLPPATAEVFDPTEFRQAVQPILDRHGAFLDSEIEAVLPCTPLQSALLTEFFKSNGQHYFNYISLQKKAGSSVGFTSQDWRGAWRQAASAIPMLRTGFINIDSVETASALSPYAMIQISSASMLENHFHVRIVKETESCKFDVGKWRADAAGQALANTQHPPWQVVIVEGDTSLDLTCHLAIHHALYDAASLQGIFDAVSRYVTTGQPVEQLLGDSTESAVADILHKATSLTGPSSPICTLWEDRASQAVVNSFPILTPLKVSPAKFHVLSKLSLRPLADLQAAVRSAGFTLNAVLQAAWTRVLSSYIGDASVVFGAVLSGRDTEATENALFPCISTLPVIATNKPRNRELVEQLMETNILLHKSQHVPLGQIQRWLGQPDARLFDTLVVYQATGSQVQLPGHPWTISDEQAVVDYPVSIEAIPRADNKLAYQVTFDTSVVPEEQAHILLDQFDAVVSHLAFCPDASEDDLVPVDPSLYCVLPPRDAELPSAITLMHQFVEVQADKQPHKTALQFVTAFDDADQPVSTEWSYQELNDRGNKVAALVARYTEPGSIVAICFDKCPEAFFTILGIFKAGCSYLALDPSAPSSRKEFILEDSGATLLLTEAFRAQDSVSKGGLCDIKAGVVQVIGIEESVLKAQDSPNMASVLAGRRETLPSDVSYCLYTSGTTGTPKGCAITHENGVQCMLAFQELFKNHYDADSKWLQFASFHFDVAVLEQYWTWSVGLTLVGAPRDLILDDLAGTIARLNITHIDLTPSLGRMLNPKDVPSLCRGVFITGGEPLKQEMLDPWGPTGAVHNFYGPTEATIGVTSYPQVPQNGRASNIGRQFPNVGSFVFRPNTQTPVLRGAVGELCVSGKLVGKGYLNRQELTNDRFPTLSEQAYPGYGERIYRTGDLVRLLHDGCFDFLGRADDQVKLRGQRLEIGEINHAIRLGLGASIGDVATLVVRDEESKKDFLVSFVVVDAADESAPANRKDMAALRVVSDAEGSAALSRRVQAACRERLPGYMVPTYVVQLPFIPLSPNNKAEVKELKRLFSSLAPEERMRTTGADSSSSDRTAEQSQSHTGKTVLSVFQKLALVGKDVTLSPDTSIFELGVDSISVLRLARALKRAGLAAATPSLVLSRPRIGDLVAALDTQRTSSVAGPVVEARLLVDACQHRHRGHVCHALGIDSEQIEYIAPCSALQQGMISRSRSRPEHKGTYFNAFQFILGDAVSCTQFHAAWAEVIRNHAILRTQFVATSDGYVQVARKTASLSWSKMGVPETDDLVSELDARHAAWVEANQGDVISQLLDIYAVSWRGRDIVVVHIFHALYDAASLGLILGEVAALCRASSPVRVEHPSFLEALTYGPLRNYSNSRPFWEDHLRGSSWKPFPVLATSGTLRTTLRTGAVSAGRTVSFAALEQLRVSLGVTHSTLVQALWVSVLQKIHGGSVTLGLVLSGRTIDDLDGVDGVVGPLFNTLPFHAAKVHGQSWASLAKLCYTFSTSTLPFQQTPLRDIQKWCSAGKPLFDVLLSFQFADEGSTTTAEVLWTVRDPEPQPDYPLALEATLAGDDLELLLVGQAEFVDAAALDLILDDFESALQDFAADPLAPVFGDDDAASVQAESHAESHAEDRAASSEAQGTSFEWDAVAVTIRREMAGLASVPESSINETTTLLELGLDSVDTIKLSARLRKAGIRLSNSQLVRGQTIVSFIGVADSKSQEPNSSHSLMASEETIAGTSAALKEYFVSSGRDLSSVASILPPTPLQEAMVADMIQSGFAVYFNNDILELAEDIDIALLKETWIRVIEKNPILRTVFYAVDSPDFDISYCQVVRAPSSMDRAITEHSVPSRDNIAAIADEARQTAVDGGGESGLFRLDFVHAADENRWYLVLSMAHALYDGWSLDLLHNTVDRMYRQGSDNSDGTAATSTSTAAYVSQIGRIFQSAGPQADDLWKSFLNGAQPTYVPRRPAVLGSDEASEKSVVRVESTSSVAADALVQFCKQQSTSVQVVGQACWAAVLSSLTGSLDVLFGVVLSGRDAEGADDLMFPTMNTVPVRVVLHGSTPDLLQYMQTNMGTIGEYQHHPLRKAQRYVGRDAASAGEPGVFNTLFILQKRVQTGNGTGISDTTTPLMKSVGGASDVEYPVCVEMEIAGDTIVWRTACDRAYVSGHGAARMLHQLDVALRFLVQTSSAVGDCSVLKFEDDGVSVCGLPPFSPKMMGIVGTTGTAGTAGTASSRVVSDTENSATWSEDELAIRSVLSSVSGVSEDAVRRTGQTLYHLGLDSISTIKVSALLKKTKGLSLGVRDMLSAGSIAEMASKATAKKREKEKERAAENEKSLVYSSLASALASLDHTAIASVVGVEPADIEMVLPATAMQAHLISVWQNTDGHVFFPTFRYRLTGPLAHGRRTIFAAWEQLVDEFPMLRTCFAATSSAAVPLVQVVLKRSVDRDTWSSLGSPARSFAHLSAVADKGGQAFSLSLTLHHALYDAVSLPTLLARLQQLCQPVRPVPSMDPYAGISISPAWINRLSAQLSETTKQHNKTFWTSYFARARITSTSTHPRPSSAATTTTGHSRVSCYRPAALSDVTHLKEAAAAFGVSLQSLVFAAYAKLLASGQTEDEAGDVVFGVYLANRDDGDSDALAGYPTLCLVPLVVRAPAQSSLVTIATQVQQDIHAISSRGSDGAVAPLTAALWEIREWTGVSVDTFVNFLLPDGVEQGQSAAVTLEADETASVGSAATSPLVHPSTYPALRESRVRAAYPDAVDIEVAVRHGHLDVGVFGSANKLGDDTGAADLVSRLVSALGDDLGL